MVDPRNTMLNAARALHDRDPNGPSWCLTCREPDGDHTEWPCPTATALGATGRSEWTMATVDTIDLSGLPATLTPEQYTRLEETMRQKMTGLPDGTLTPDRCGTVRTPWEWATAGCTPETNPTNYPCTRDHGHPGAHIDTDNETWTTPRTPAGHTQWPNHQDPCTTPSISAPGAKHCIHHDRHTGPHHFEWDGDYTPCGHPGPTGTTCVLGTEHTTHHSNIHGTEWTTAHSI